MNRPPFSPDTARSAGQNLGLSPHQVTEQTNAYGVVVDVTLLQAQEAGEYRSTEDELFVLADVLWCRTKDLMGIESPCTLTELLLVRQFSTDRLARSIGMDTAQYERVEDTNSWSGDGRQTSALLRVLDLTPSGSPKPPGSPSHRSRRSRDSRGRHGVVADHADSAR
ncbi:XRE family transcriptional regulator [Streptomyces sp. NPDC050549]|uniref:XRE family transcriptional regulator n=1 Tax=Streptomyces sp. NPDC050549 TaxID=3155406 RepID=UPI003435DE38